MNVVIERNALANVDVYSLAGLERDPNDES